jgi:hypothetical protein
MRIFRVTIWSIIALLGAFLALNPFINGVQDAASELRIGTHAKDAAVTRAQGGATAEDRADHLNTKIAVRRETQPIQAVLFKSQSVQLGACGGLMSIMIVGEAVRRHAYRRAAERARRPPSTSLSTRATHVDPIHGTPTRTHPTGAPVRTNIDRVETLGCVGLLAHMPEDPRPLETTGRGRRR